MKKTVVFLLCLFLLCGCTPKEKTSGKLQVVTTLFPYYDFVREIAKDCADVTLLLTPGREAHSFEPTPTDVVTLSEADLFIYNGGESEEWVEDILEAAGENISLSLCMFDYVDPREEEFSEGMQQSRGHEEEEETEYDEHIWTSPRNAAAAVQAITDGLCRIDAKNADLYHKNETAYLAKLSTLDDSFRALRREAKRNLLVFGDRFPLLYLCKAYDLDYRAAFHGCSSDTEPSLATMEYLIRTVRENDIPVIYTVDLDSKKIAEAIAECTDAEIETLYSAQTVSRADFQDGETYLSLMKRNLNALRKGLM